MTLLEFVALFLGAGLSLGVFVDVLRGLVMILIDIVNAV